MEQFSFSRIFLIEDYFTHLGINEGIRFQLKTDPRGLVGFVREISNVGARLKIGKLTDAPKNESHDLDEIEILHYPSHGLI